MSFQALYCGAWSFKIQVAGVHGFMADPADEPVKASGIFGEEHPGQSILAFAGKYLVSVCETRDTGKILSYEILGDHSLALKDVLSVDSTLLSYVVAAPGGKYVFTSSMGNGTVRMIRVDEDGRLSLTDEFRLTGHSVTPRQNGAKTHSVMISPDGALLAAANLGADEVEVFRVDYEKERLVLLSGTPVDFGKEPRHMAFHPSGKYLYLLTEAGSRLYVFLVREGELQELAVYQNRDPEGPQTGSPADLVMSADGHFLYSTNRGQNNIAVWKTLESGLLDTVAFVPCGGKGPRGLNLSPDGKTLLCANNEDGTVTAMELDPETGIPGPAYLTLSVPGAGCVRSL